MTTSATSIEMPAPTNYGAVELKVFIRKNTIKAFIISTVALVLLLLIYWVTGVLSKETEAVKFTAPISKIQLDVAPQQEEAEDDLPPPPPTQQIIDYATVARAGTPVPIPDSEIKEDLKEFASVDQLDKSLAAKEGQIVDFGDLPKDLDLGSKIDVQKEELPDIDDFIPVEKEPGVDLAELQRKIVYPEVARRANIEGKVVVRVLVGKNGKPIKVVVQQSDSQMLDAAADRKSVV